MDMHAADTMTKPTTRRTPVPMHGVDTPKLFATIQAIAGQPELAAFRFRTQCRWLDGTHSRSTVSDFSGAGGEHAHISEFIADADHPAVLCGEDSAPAPVEHVLNALAACLTAGIANIAAARGIRLTSVESNVEGDIDLRGILGISDEVRNGFTGIRVRFRLQGDAPAEKLAEIVAQSRARSAVFDVLTNGVPVSIAIEG